MRILRQPEFLVVALSHFTVDVLNSQVSLLLAVLSGPLQLANAAIGLIATVYSIVGSLSQPVFGWLTDRFGGGWSAAGGVVWMASLFGLAAISPGYWPLPLLILGSLGSAAFHPSGAARASESGRSHMAGRAATAASIFFLFGQSGLSLGPALGGVTLQYFGLRGLLLIAGAAMPIGVLALRQLRPIWRAAPPSPQAAAARDSSAALSPIWSVFVLTLVVSALRSWAQFATTTFTPKFLHDLGELPAFYGLVVALFMGGSAVGGVLGALVADRGGYRLPVTVALAAGAVPLYFMPVSGTLWMLPLAAAAGLLNGAPHSVLVTMAQRALPGRAALASGLILGLMFAAGSLGAYFSGLAADRLGLAVVLQGNALISLAAAALSLALRRT